MSKRKSVVDDDNIDNNFHYIAELSHGYGFRSKRGRLSQPAARSVVHSASSVPSLAAATSAAATAFAPTVEETGHEDLTFTLDFVADSTSTIVDDDCRTGRGITVSCHIGIVLTPKELMQNLQGMVDGWLPHRDEYLDALLVLDGPAGGVLSTDCPILVTGSDGSVHACGKSGAVYRCRDCHDYGVTVCQECCVRAHRTSPFHRVQVSLQLLAILRDAERHGQRWTDNFFDDIELSTLGITLHMGHRGQPCPAFIAGRHSDVRTVVFHTSGWSYQSVRYCVCSTTPKHLQLLEASLFPATASDPRTLFAMDFLNVFHILTLQGKVSLHDFYQSICRLTDNMGRRPVMVRLVLPYELEVNLMV